MKVLAFSGGKDSMACLHLLRAELDCAVYVNTGFAYPETLALVEYARTMLPVHEVRSIRGDALPADVVPVDWTPFGQLCTGAKKVTIRSYHECCFASIAEPLIRRAQELGATELVYGQRNDESHKATSRDGDVVCGMIRRHPIENWTALEVFAYLATKMTVPEHFRIHHSSLDCHDCTAYRSESVDRIEWTRERHPEFHAAYLERSALLDGALKEAMYGQ